MIKLEVLLVSMLVLSTRIACLLHEVLGHSLVGAAFGRGTSAIEVSLFGGGSVQLTNALGWASEFWPIAAGMLVNLVTGFVALVVLERARPRSDIAMLLALLGACSVLTPVAYAAFGLHYGCGDPASLAVALVETPSAPTIRFGEWPDYLGLWRAVCRGGSLRGIAAPGVRRRRRV